MNLGFPEMAKYLLIINTQWCDSEKYKLLSSLNIDTLTETEEYVHAIIR